MRISSKSEYGLRALFELALAYGTGPLRSRDIADRQSIDENYLNQLLIQLRRAGLLQSVRGPQGGHVLARAPQEISLLEMLEALEGPIVDVPETTPPQHAADAAIISEVWIGLRQHATSYLQQQTLADLLQRRRERDSQEMYYI